MSAFRYISAEFSRCDTLATSLYRPIYISMPIQRLISRTLFDDFMKRLVWCV